jgi:hypothetical protein
VGLNRPNTDANNIIIEGLLAFIPEEGSDSRCPLLSCCTSAVLSENSDMPVQTPFVDSYGHAWCLLAVCRITNVLCWCASYSIPSGFKRVADEDDVYAKTLYEACCPIHNKSHIRLTTTYTFVTISRAMHEAIVHVIVHVVQVIANN